VTAAQFDQAVKDYFHSLTPLFVALDASRQAGSQTNAPQVYQFPVPVGPNDSAIIAKPVRETDGRASVAEMKIRIPERREAALQELQGLATTPDPATPKAAGKKDKADNQSTTLVTAEGNEIAHRALAWDHLQRGELDSAAEELGDAAALNQRDMWIRYYLSVLKYRISQDKHTDIQGLPNMMLDLRAVLDWYPEFANAYDLMALARLQGGGPVAAMQAEHAAVQLSPRNQRYVYHLAQIYVADKRWDAAKGLLERLKSGSDAQVAALARAELERIPTEQKYGISAASATANQKLSTQHSPFDVLEQDAAKRAAAQATPTGGPGDRRPAKFLQGRLVGVDCSQSPSAVLTVTSGSIVLKLRTADYKSLLLIGADAFSCEWSNRAVSVNYRPGGMADGDLVSVEVR
jgi:hypothetical protein